jgi:exonuclease III
MCIGDFNEILASSETSSNSIRPRSQMQSFQTTLGDCNLADLVFRGPKFTWWNGRHGADFIREILDRAVANPAWTRMFDAAEVEVLANIVSDHHPLLVSVSHSDAINGKSITSSDMKQAGQGNRSIEK